MKKLLIYITACGAITSSCSDFLDITPQNSITNPFDSASSIALYVNDVYSSLEGPLYQWDALGDIYNRSMFDNAFTDDLYNNDNKWNLFSFTASSAPFDRWTACYEAIRKANVGIEQLGVSEKLTEKEKERFLGDMHFLRAMFYLELWRFYGPVPLIEKSLDRTKDDIYIARSDEQTILEFIVAEFDLASKMLPSELDDKELGRATQGAALGMMAVAYLHAAGTIDEAYYENAYKTADILISGDLKGTYDLFRTGVTPQERYQNLFLEQYEYNCEVIFDIQYAYPYKFSTLQTIASPPKHATDGYGWGNRDNPTQEIVDAYEMNDGSYFDWSNPTHSANPYANRDARFYASILYNGALWKGETLYTSTNVWSSAQGRFVPNAPNGWGTATNSTVTGYYLRKHMNESVVAGADNRTKGVGGGHNLIVLRYAEILLIYAEARNETLAAPDQTVYDAVNAVRVRAGQPVLPQGLSRTQMRDRIRHERRIELAFENKRYFDIIRWKAGTEYLNNEVHGMRITYSGNGSSPTIRYERPVLIKKEFDPGKNYLLPVPQNAMNRNPNLYPNNPGW